MGAHDEIKPQRIKIEYDSKISGTPEPKELALRLMFFGKFSSKTEEEKNDLIDREVHSLNGSNTNDVMRKMGISLKMSVPNMINPGEEESLDVDIPIDSMDAFGPDQVAHNIPRLKELLEIKRLLGDTLTQMGNNRDFAKKMDEIYSNRDSFESYKKLFAPMEVLRIKNGSAEGQ